MFVPKEDKLRHKVLGILLEKRGSLNKRDADCADFSVRISELAKTLNATEKEIFRISAALVQAKEAAYCKSTDERGLLYCSDNGMVAFNEKKYIKNGRKYINDSIYSIYDVVKWLVPASLAFVTIYSTVIVQRENRHSKENISKLQQEVQLIKNAANLQSLQKIYSDSTSLRKVE